MHARCNHLNSIVDSNSKGNKLAVFVAFVFLMVFTFTISADETAQNLSVSAPVSVGVVNVTYLMEHVPQAEVASNHLKSKFLPREKVLAKELDEIQALEAALEKDARNLNTEQRRDKEREIRAKKRSRNRSLQDFREELRFARDSALDDVQKEVFLAIDTVRKQKKIDLVLQDYVSASKRIDITSSVLQYLKDKLAKEQAMEKQEK